MGLLDRYGAWLVAVLVLALCYGASLAVGLLTRMPDEDDFNVVAWEIRNIPGKWLYLTGEFFAGGMSKEQEDEKLARYLALSSSAVAEGSVDERDALENEAEAIIEGRLTEVLEDAGLESSFPLLADVQWVFPPVDVEFDEPPRSLTVSPRVRIQMIERRPLRPGFTLEEAVAREEEVESAGDVSALVGTLSGAATYPSIVAPHGDYERLVATVAHEWAHHYLYFKPLGSRYYESIELRTLNETVAELTGNALAAMFVERYPLPGIETGPTPTPEVDVFAVLGDLRFEVEQLLSAGQIEAAEALMEERRLKLAEEGIVFRRINQAFFAATGIYATSPGSIDPIGQKLETLLEQSDGVGEFLHPAEELTSEDDLDALLTTSDDTARR